MIFAICCVPGPVKLGRPGRESTPAYAGLIRLPAAGRLPPDFTTIQWAASQGLTGKVNDPEKTEPAVKTMVSPQLAALSADCRSPPLATVVTLPVCVGTVVLTLIRGSSAGPSYDCPHAIPKDRNEAVIATNVNAI